jgi:hypothetical protein
MERKEKQKKKEKEKKEKEWNRIERKEQKKEWKLRKIKEKKGKERRTPYIAKAFSANAAHFTKDGFTKYCQDPAPNPLYPALSPQKKEWKEERNCGSAWRRRW